MHLTEDVNTTSRLLCLSYNILPFLGQQPDIKLHQQYISQLLIDQYRFLPHLLTQSKWNLYVNEWNRNWKLPADESDSRIRSIALVSDWNKFIFWVSPKKERFEIIIHY